jgi:hypothetical protein
MPTLLEISMAVDPDAWNEDLWALARGPITEMHRRRQAANETAKRVAKLFAIESEPVAPPETSPDLSRCETSAPR